MVVGCLLFITFQVDVSAIDKNVDAFEFEIVLDFFFVLEEIVRLLVIVGFHNNQIEFGKEHWPIRREE